MCFWRKPTLKNCDMPFVSDSRRCCCALLCYSNTWLVNKKIQLKTPGTYRDLFMVMLWTKQLVLKNTVVKEFTTMSRSWPGQTSHHLDYAEAAACNCPHVQNSALLFDKLHKISLGPYLKFINVPFVCKYYF